MRAEQGYIKGVARTTRGSSTETAVKQQGHSEEPARKQGEQQGNNKGSGRKQRGKNEEKQGARKAVWEQRGNSWQCQNTI